MAVQRGRYRATTWKVKEKGLFRELLLFLKYTVHVHVLMPCRGMRVVAVLGKSPRHISIGM